MTPTGQELPPGEGLVGSGPATSGYERIGGALGILGALMCAHGPRGLSTGRPPGVNNSRPLGRGVVNYRWWLGTIRNPPSVEYFVVILGLSMPGSFHRWWGGGGQAEGCTPFSKTFCGFEDPGCIRGRNRGFDFTTARGRIGLRGFPAAPGPPGPGAQETPKSICFAGFFNRMARMATVCETLDWSEGALSVGWDLE